MKNKTFFICLLAAIGLIGIDLNALDENKSLLSLEQKAVFSEKASKLFEQFYNTLESLYSPFGSDIFLSEKLCDIAYLNQTKKILKEIPANIEKCKAAYRQQQQDIEIRLAEDILPNVEDRMIFLEALKNTGVNSWIAQYCEIQKSLVETAEEAIDFFINNHAHYQVQNKLIVFDSIDKVREGSALFEEISHLQQELTEHINFLHLQQ